jgi:lysophospholipid acyltransferase (LPLAT)-like uncharacterized protein
LVHRAPLDRYIPRFTPAPPAPLPHPAPEIFACTHQDMFDSFNALPRMLPARSLATMVSYSRDGNLSSLALRMLGYEIVRGSSSRGGGEALLMLRSGLVSGTSVALACDGPKAPLGDVKPGIVHLAASAGAPILPIRAWGLVRLRFYRSWARTAVTLPFLPAVVCIGDPIEVGADVRDTRPYQVTIARALADLSAAASVWANGPPVAPFAVSRE